MDEGLTLFSRAVEKKFKIIVHKRQLSKMKSLLSLKTDSNSSSVQKLTPLIRRNDLSIYPLSKVTFSIKKKLCNPAQISQKMVLHLILDFLNKGYPNQ
jgi:hypothetical protein